MDIELGIGGERTSSTQSDSTPQISVVHVSIPNQPVQVQSVIHSSQASVIQSPSGPTLQTIQVPVNSLSQSDDEDEDGRKRRELLSRRPSYRKILNELSSDTGGVVTLAKVDEESSNGSHSQEATDGNEGSNSLSNAAILPTQTIHIAAHGDGAPGLQTLTMTNSNSSTPAGATIVQYAQGPDGQFYIPAFTTQAIGDNNQITLSSGNIQAYQISTPTSLPQGVVMASAGALSGQGGSLSEGAAGKRELRLLKNRDAARECRRKKKEYVKCLENRVAVLENQNKALIEELKSLKELYCQKEAASVQ